MSKHNPVGWLSWRKCNNTIGVWCFSCWRIFVTTRNGAKMLISGFLCLPICVMTTREGAKNSTLRRFRVCAFSSEQQLAQISHHIYITEILFTYGPFKCCFWWVFFSKRSVYPSSIVIRNVSFQMLVKC